MCIRVQYAPRHEITDPWVRDRNTILIPDELGATTLFTLRAVRAVLQQLGVEQGTFGAVCWCGETISMLPAIPTQRRSNEVIHLGA
ncbi:hypothetical protein [Streptomyces sp. L2]|uniref:hypothetical protein n=1 Tax=Streptomyces sp. L2 TaxID=2162665 RepID=UPI0010127703|nr:hypothetical protein [Streptomyces sp. L2]